MTSTADAGPPPAFSSGVAPGTVGKPAGRLSQILPQSVSLWLTVEPLLGAPDGVTDAAATAVGAGDAVAAVLDPLDPHPARTTTRPSSRTGRRWSVTIGRSTQERERVDIDPGMA